MRKTVPYLLAALLLTLTPVLKAQPASPYQVKAAFLYNFFKFIDWPQSTSTNASNPYVVGILGKDPFGPIIDNTMRDKTIDGRPISVRRISEEQARECHMVFVSASERRRLKEIFVDLRGAPVLTVGETDGFAEAGGIVNFTVEENKVRFQINIEAAKRAGLKIHSTLLNLAKVIRDHPS